MSTSYGGVPLKKRRIECDPSKKSMDYDNTDVISIDDSDDDDDDSEFSSASSMIDLKLPTDNMTEDDSLGITSPGLNTQPASAVQKNRKTTTLSPAPTKGNGKKRKVSMSPTDSLAKVTGARVPTKDAARNANQFEEFQFAEATPTAKKSSKNTDTTKGRAAAAKKKKSKGTKTSSTKKKAKVATKKPKAAMKKLEKEMALMNPSSSTGTTRKLTIDEILADSDDDDDPFSFGLKRIPRKRPKETTTENPVINASKAAKEAGKSVEEVPRSKDATQFQPKQSKVNDPTSLHSEQHPRKKANAKRTDVSFRGKDATLSTNAEPKATKKNAEAETNSTDQLACTQGLDDRIAVQDVAIAQQKETTKTAGSTFDMHVQKTDGKSKSKVLDVCIEQDASVLKGTAAEVGKQTTESSNLDNNAEANDRPSGASAQKYAQPERERSGVSATEGNKVPNKKAKRKASKAKPQPDESGTPNSMETTKKAAKSKNYLNESSAWQPKSSKRQRVKTARYCDAGIANPETLEFGTPNSKETTKKTAESKTSKAKPLADEPGTTNSKVTTKKTAKSKKKKAQPKAADKSKTTVRQEDAPAPNTLKEPAKAQPKAADKNKKTVRQEEAPAPPKSKEPTKASAASLAKTTQGKDASKSKAPAASQTRKFPATDSAKNTVDSSNASKSSIAAATAAKPVTTKSSKGNAKPKVVKANAAGAKPKSKPKKLRYDQQIFRHMATAMKPFSMRSLAQELKTTEQQLHNTLLGMKDKQLVFEKEFTSSKGRSKTLIWANLEAKEIIETNYTPEKASALAREVQFLLKHEKDLQEELAAVVATPCNKELSAQVESEEAIVAQLRRKVEETKERIRSANAQQSEAPPKPTAYGGFQRKPKSGAQPARQRSPRRMKMLINAMRSEWKNRKDKCKDFVDAVADGMEKKPKDVIKLLGVETDESVGAVMPPKYEV